MNRPQTGRADSRAAALLVRLYPPSWRERYEREYLALLADTGLSTGGVLDAVWGAGLAWTRPTHAVLSGDRRLRASVSVVWCAWLAMAGALLVFAQLTEDKPFQAAGSAHPWLARLHDICQVAGVASVAVAALGAVPLALSIWRSAAPRGRGATRALIATPMIIPVAFLATVVGIARLAPHSSRPGVGVGPTWFALIVLLGSACGVACAAAPVLALRRATPSPAALRTASIAMLPLLGTIAVAAIASVTYAILLGFEDPRLEATVASGGILLPFALLMASCIAIAVTSASRALRAQVRRC